MKFLKKNKEPKVNNFINTSYQQHNVKRLSHLEYLNFSFKNKKVLEIGAGIGDHTYYYLIKGATVTSTDARPELVDTIKRRFGNDCFVLDVEQELDKLKRLPTYDLIHCYGLLYHINNPENFINSLKGKAKILLLETCVSHDFRPDGPYLVDEDLNDLTQAVSGKGCRPTRRWLFDALKRNFKHVYLPLSQPNHDEFPKDWKEPIEDRKSLIRAIFIASEDELQNRQLSTEIPIVYDNFL